MRNCKAGCTLESSKSKRPKQVNTTFRSRNCTSLLAAPGCDKASAVPPACSTAQRGGDNAATARRNMERIWQRSPVSTTPSDCSNEETYASWSVSQVVFLQTSSALFISLAAFVDLADIASGTKCWRSCRRPAHCIPSSESVLSRSETLVRTFVKCSHKGFACLKDRTYCCKSDTADSPSY